MWYTCNGILYSLIKERNSDTYYNIGGTWAHNNKWKKYCMILLIQDYLE